MISAKHAFLLDVALAAAVAMGLTAGVVQICSDYRRLAAIADTPLPVEYEPGRCDREMFAVEACLFESTDCRAYLDELDACHYDTH